MPSRKPARDGPFRERRINLDKPLAYSFQVKHEKNTTHLAPPRSL